MFLHKVSPSSKNWRTQLLAKQLVTQVSSVLLQRRNWVPDIRNLRLSATLTADSFFQILIKIRHHPQISLSFFSWVISNTSFKPDFKSHCHVIYLALGLGLSQSAYSILNSLVDDNHSASSISKEILRVDIRNKLPHSPALDHLIEFYSHQGLASQGLQVFSLMRAYGITPSIPTCNLLMEVLYKEKGVSAALCCYGAMIRGGFMADYATWSLISEIMYRNKKLQTMEKLLDSGIVNSNLYANIIDGFCKIGNLEAALNRLTEMQTRNLEVGFEIYSSLLEGACREENSEMINYFTSLIDENIEFDSMIQKLCNLDRVSAAMMFYGKSLDQKIELQQSTYQCLLGSLSKNGKVDEAIGLYRTVQLKDLSMHNALIPFSDLLCLSPLCEERVEILEEIIKGDFSPGKVSILRFLSSLCCAFKWREVEKWLNLFIDKDLLPDFVSLKGLFKHYCSKGEIGKALELHKRMGNRSGGLDIESYNVMLEGLIKENKIEDAVGLFDYMMGKEKVDSRSFTRIIYGLLKANERRKAMEFHDLMVKIGLKPEKKTYRKLVVALTSSSMAEFSS